MKGKENYEELPDHPLHKESGEYFLKRYRAMAPDAVFIDPKGVRQALRVSARRADQGSLITELTVRGATLERIPFLRSGFFASASFSFGATPEYLLGNYYLQGPLSQLACEILDPKPGTAVLDMAAAPGGKTTYLAAMVAAAGEAASDNGDGGDEGDGPKGIVVALDNDAMRLAAVRNNAERMGMTNVVCCKKDARFATDFKAKFDAVLLDAPCSGNYCSEDGWFGKRTIEDIRNNARAQRELIRAAYACLAPGGRLLYSTCSLEPEEDEMVIDWALGKLEGLDVVALNTLPIGDQGTVSWEGTALDKRIAGTRRFWPHRTGMEGFFIALLEKRT